MKNKFLVVALIAVVFGFIGVGVGVVYAQNNTPENNVRWEYDIYFPTGIGINIDNLKGQMQHKGREGWEFVGAAGQGTIFKRRLP